MEYGSMRWGREGSRTTPTNDSLARQHNHPAHQVSSLGPLGPGIFPKQDSIASLHIPQLLLDCHHCPQIGWRLFLSGITCFLCLNFIDLKTIFCNFAEIFRIGKYKVVHVQSHNTRNFQFYSFPWHWHMLLSFDDPKTFCVNKNQMLTVSGLWGGLYTAQLVLIHCFFLLFWKTLFLFMCIMYLFGVSMCLRLLLKHRKRVSSQMTRPLGKLLEKVHTEDCKELKESRPLRERAKTCFALHQLLHISG